MESTFEIVFKMVIAACVFFAAILIGALTIMGECPVALCIFSFIYLGVAILTIWKY